MLFTQDAKFKNGEYEARNEWDTKSRITEWGVLLLQFKTDSSLECIIN